MKRRSGLLSWSIVCCGALALNGCSGHGSSNLPGSTDSSFLQDARTTNVSVAAAGPRSDETALTVANQPIVDADPPNVAGSYAGSIQDRLQGDVSRGTVVLVLNQSGPAVSGTIEVSDPDQVTDAFTGTVAKTTRGAILHLSIANAQGRIEGLWAKVIGTTLFGKGWADPYAGHAYEQLIFTMHKTSASTPSPAPSANPTASPGPPTSAPTTSPPPIGSPAPIMTPSPFPT